MLEPPTAPGRVFRAHAGRELYVEFNGKGFGINLLVSNFFL